MQGCGANRSQAPSVTYVPLHLTPTWPSGAVQSREVASASFLHSPATSPIQTRSKGIPQGSNRLPASYQVQPEYVLPPTAASPTAAQQASMQLAAERQSSVGSSSRPTSGNNTSTAASSLSSPVSLPISPPLSPQERLDALQAANTLMVLATHEPEDTKKMALLLMTMGDSNLAAPPPVMREYVVRHRDETLLLRASNGNATWAIAAIRAIRGGKRGSRGASKRLNVVDGNDTEVAGDDTDDNAATKTGGAATYNGGRYGGKTIGLGKRAENSEEAEEDRRASILHALELAEGPVIREWMRTCKRTPEYWNYIKRKMSQEDFIAYIEKCKATALMPPPTLPGKGGMKRKRDNTHVERLDLPAAKKPVMRLSQQNLARNGGAATSASVEAPVEAPILRSRFGRELKPKKLDF